MKKFRYLTSLVIMSAAMATLHAQVNDPVELKSMLESKQYVFKARTASPQGGGSRQLTSEYDLTLAGDRVISYLPFFGRSYGAIPYSGEGGIKFTSTDFDYSIKESKKAWKITILPKDVHEVQRIYLDVSKGGYATLRVSSTNRSNISFYGVIEKPKQR